MEKARYQYQPLQNDCTIRILVLDPGQHDDPLTATLETVHVDCIGNFEAISYVWADPGPPNKAYEILIRDTDANEGLLVLRGGSIFAALCRLRHPGKPRRIWADQCCINQDDPEERSQQIQFMNPVYRGADHILVWLGLDQKKEAVSAFDLVHELDKALKGIADDLGNNSDTVDPSNMVVQHVTDSQKALQSLTACAWVSCSI
jgi:hypothetical protein